MSDTNEKKDDLLELIDSLDIDDDLNRKMDLFTQNKRKWENQKEKEARKEDTQEVILSSGDTIEKTIQNPLAEGSGTKTIVFEKPAESTKDAGGTVVIGEKEIQSFIEEEKIIPQKSEAEATDYSDTKKKILYIVLTILFGLLLCFGVYRFASGYFTKNDDASEQQNEYYTEIKTWAESYDTLTDEEKAKIVDLEAKFNKLDDDKKAEIDSILVGKTGSTFDELLANAKSGEQTSKKNNNTELAEQKAELKKQISSLEEQISQAETDLNAANEELETAQADFDSWAAAVDTSGAALSEAYNEQITACESTKDTDTESDEDTKEDDSCQKAKDALTKAQSQYDSDYANYTNSYSILQEKQVNSQNAQGTYDSLYAQYNDLQAQLAALGD